MSCKYTSTENKKLCRLIYGECQFQKSGSETVCPILGEYVSWENDSDENAADDIDKA